MPDYNTYAFVEASRRVASGEEIYYEIGLFHPHEPRARTIRIRLARLIVAAVKHWPTSETMSCCKWFSQELRMQLERKPLRASRRVESDIKIFQEYLDELIGEFETNYEPVDPMVFGKFIIMAGPQHVGLGFKMSGSESFIWGPVKYSWGDRGDGVGFYDTPIGQLSLFARNYL